MKNIITREDAIAAGLGEKDVLTVGELKEELEKYPVDSLIVLGLCHRKGSTQFVKIKRDHCQRQLAGMIDFERNEWLEPDTDRVLIHGVL